MEDAVTPVIDSLVEDAKVVIFSYLNFAEAFAVCQVSKHWNQTILGLRSSLVLPQSFDVTQRPQLFKSLISRIYPHYILELDVSQCPISGATLRELLMLDRPVGGCFDRLRYLTISSTQMNGISCPEDGFPFSQIVSSVRIVGSNEDLSQSGIDVFKTFSSLRELYLDRTDARLREALFSANFAQLRHLTLGSSPDLAATEFNECSKHLRNLTHLCFTGADGVDVSVAAAAFAPEKPPSVLLKAQAVEICRTKLGARAKALQYWRGQTYDLVGARLENDHVIALFHFDESADVQLQPLPFAVSNVASVCSVAHGFFNSNFCLCGLDNGRVNLHWQWSGYDDRFVLGQQFDPLCDNGAACTAVDMFVNNAGAAIVAAAYNDGGLCIWINEHGRWRKFADAVDVTGDDISFMKWAQSSLITVSNDEPNDALIWSVGPNEVTRQRTYQYHRSKITFLRRTNFFVEHYLRPDSLGMLSGDSTGLITAWQPSSTLTAIATFKVSDHIGITITESPHVDKTILFVCDLTYHQPSMVAAITSSHLLLWEKNTSLPLFSFAAPAGHVFTSMTEMRESRTRLAVFALGLEHKASGSFALSVVRVIT